METRLIKAEEQTEEGAFGLPQVESGTSLQGSCKDRRRYLAQRQVEAHSVPEEKCVFRNDEEETMYLRFIHLYKEEMTMPIKTL